MNESRYDRMTREELLVEIHYLLREIENLKYAAKSYQVQNPHKSRQTPYELNQRR